MSEGKRSRNLGDDVEILVVEDTPGDIRLIEEAFEETDRETSVHTVTNGYDAIYYLKQRGSLDPALLPDLAFVDLNVPGKDGCQILESIRDEPQLRLLPVIIFTDSDAREDVLRCYDAAANAYITKPSDLEGYVTLIREIERFWFDRVQLPPLS